MLNRLATTVGILALSTGLALAQTPAAETPAATGTAPSAAQATSVSLGSSTGAPRLRLGS